MRAIKQTPLIFLVTLLLFPSAVKFTHFLSSHQHNYCDHYAASHFHQEILDCDVLKFQHKPFVSVSIIGYETIPKESVDNNPVSAYVFLSDYKKLPFALRGPPTSA